MGKNDIYELIDLKGNPHPDVCDIFSWKVDSCVCNQEIDIRDVIKYVELSNKDCLDALQDLSIALSTGIYLSYTIILCQEYIYIEKNISNFRSLLFSIQSFRQSCIVSSND